MLIRRRYHLHPPGLIYCVVTVLLGLGALNSQNNLLFGAFGLALGGLLISGIVSGAMLMGLRIRRVGVEPAPVGEDVIIRYEIENRSRIYPVFAVRVGEHCKPSAALNNHIELHDALVMHLGPKQSVRLASQCPAKNRGEFSLDAIRIMTRFPFGIIRKSIILPEHTQGLVHPLRIDARRLNESIGSAISGDDPAPVGRRRGVEVDLMALRDYVPGDSPRTIAWRATARTGEMVVRDSQSATPARRWVALDLTDQAGDIASDDKCEHAIALAAAAIERITMTGGAPGLLVPASGLRIAPTSTNRQGVRGATRERPKERELLDELARIDLSRCKPAPMDLAERIGANASVILIDAMTGGAETPPAPRSKVRAR